MRCWSGCCGEGLNAGSFLGPILSVEDPGVQPIPVGDGDDVADDVVAADVGVGASYLRNSADVAVEVLGGEPSFGKRARANIGSSKGRPWATAPGPGNGRAVVAQLDGGER